MRSVQEKASSASTPPDADLVRRCLDGDPAAWDALVRIYWRRVFNIAYKFVARYDEAEDLTQEIFVKLFSALRTYDRRATFETWLTRVSRNLCIDRYRRKRREAEKFADDVDPDALSLEELVSRPDTTLEQRDDRYRLSARMTRIGAGLYLDVTPLDGTDLPALTLPVHGCLRVELVDEGLSLAELNYEWFERQRGEAKLALPFVVDARRNVVITAGTAELRQWIAQNADAEGVFAAPTTFTRR